MTSEQRTRIALNAAIVAKAALDLTETENTVVIRMQLFHLIGCVHNLEGVVEEVESSEKKGEK